jgi:phosphoserine phosphatase
MQLQEITRKGFVVVDICGTLYNSNTTFDFLDSYIQSVYYHAFRSISMTFCGKVVNALFWRMFRLDLVRMIAFRFIKGHDKVTLLQAADVFCRNYLSDRKHEKVFSIIDRYKEQQYEIIVASATMDVVAEVVAKRNSIPMFFSSTLAYRDGVCCGKILVDLLGKKMETLIKNGIMPPFKAVITDNTSDISLIRNAEFSYIILNDQNKKEWNRLIQKYQLKSYQMI